MKTHIFRRAMSESPETLCYHKISTPTKIHTRDSWFLWIDIVYIFTKAKNFYIFHSLILKRTDV